jgi:hypothetical protein
MTKSALATVADLKKAAVAYGATVENDAPGVYQVVAPVGKWWRESSGPHLRVDFQEYGGRVGDAKWRSEEISDAINRMKSGLEDAGEE